MKRKLPIADPRIGCWGPWGTNCWDAANLYVPSGKHAFCDVNGKSLKLSDITNGMSVKIRAKNVRYHGYEYLFTSAEGSYGMYFALYNIKTWLWYAYLHLHTERNFFWAGYAYYDVLRSDKESNDHKKQTWIVKKDPSDGTFLFESTYWNRGNYLNGNEGSFLYCDTDGSSSWWNVTVNNCEIFCPWTRTLQKQKELSYFGNV